MYAKLRINILTTIVVIALSTTLAFAQSATPDTVPEPGEAGPGTNAGTQLTPRTGELCFNGKLQSTDTARDGQPCTPLASGALLQDGIFGCNASKYENIGRLSAMGGVYVPVNDAAVTLNTGYLVYKECVLDGVVSAIKNSAVADLQKATIRSFETGRGGNKQYLENWEDLRPYKDRLVLNIITNAQNGNMCAAFKNRVPTAAARNYYASSRGTDTLACSFTGTDAERIALTQGTSIVNWSAFNSLIRPENYETGQYYLLQAQNEAALAECDQNMRQMLDWGRGVFPAFDANGDCNAQRVITPAYIIADSVQKMINAGTDILVNADEINQVNSSLQAGFQSTIVSDTIRGLSGLVRSQNGQPSYLDRMASEASANVRTSAVNTALGILAATRQVELVYRNAKQSTAVALTNAITRLRTAEATCWSLIVPKVQEKAALEGATLRIATSTQFSQAIIESQIQSLATTTLRDLRISEETLVVLDQLIADVTNSASAAAQRAALERLDSMVANNQLHSAADGAAAQKQKDDIIAALTILIDDTLKAWGDSTDPSIGWCNANNAATIDRWFNAWKQ